ncbi:hypothetical protein TYRP_013567, partial [Tyrophagus putrescentiae]
HALNSRGLMVPRAKRAGLEETEVDSGQVTSEICEKAKTKRRGLAPLVHCKLPLPRVPQAERVYKRCRVSRRVLRAKLAGPEETEVNSDQVTSEIRDK